MSVQYAFSQIVTNGLVLALDPADKNSYAGSGLVWYDLSGNNSTGSLINGPTFNSNFNGSIVFDGVNDYVDFGSPSILDISGDMTVSSWHLTNGDYTSSQALYVNGSDVAGRGGLVFGFNDFKYTWFQNGSSATVPGSSTINTDQWRNVVATRTSSSVWTISIYINGVLDITTSSVVNPGTNSTSSISKFGSFSGYYLKGSIGPTLVYNRALSSSEILLNYNATKVRFGL